MFCDFKTTTHGKWILTGEHAVIRGYHALVFPLLSKTLELEYTAEPQQTPWDNAEILQALLQRGFESDHLSGPRPSLRRLGLGPTPIPGHFKITNTIPIGSGLGASAALCVAIARWFIAQGYPAEALTLARHLEHFFHGQSSGVDIIGSSSSTPVDFQKDNSTPFIPAWQPHWGLSYSGSQCSTKNCVAQVDNINTQAIDEQMQQSTLLAKQALLSNDPHAITDLANAIQLAQDCFQKWGLIQDQLELHMQLLLNQGALAVKPTGSGGGGYVLSLWETANSVPQTDNILRLL